MRAGPKARDCTVLLLVNKPFGVLCQFSDPAGRPTLAGLVNVPAVYPAGRLDSDSEGLVLLTDDGALQARIAYPVHALEKTYLAQVEGRPDATAIQALQRGVTLRDGPTRPARVRAVPAPALWPREPPIRARRAIPTAWLEIVITEGRNRQVRRMTAAVGLPTLRLVRVAVGPVRVDGLGPGQWRAATPAELGGLSGHRAATPPARRRGPAPRTAPASRARRTRPRAANTRAPR